MVVVRKPEKIAEILVKICKENDDRVGQALFNALWETYGEHKAYDTFNIEDDELLKILEAYHKHSIEGNKKVI